MERQSPGLAFVSYEPAGPKCGDKRAREVRVHAGKAGWLKSSKAAQVEAKKKEKEEKAKSKQKDVQSYDTVEAMDLLPRPVAPVFGGVRFKTFDAAGDDISARIGYLMLTAVWPNTAGQSVAAAWFVDFCNEPIMFHVHCTAGAMYRDVLAQKSEWSRGQVTLTHKAHTLSLIRDAFCKLDTLTQPDVERLLLAMGILAVHEFDPKHVEPRALPFEPHFPATNWSSLWGRTNIVEPHMDAVFAVTKRLGGAKALQLPGLGFMAALTDLFRSSYCYKRPTLECYWDDIHILDVMPEEPFIPLPGSGFTSLPGHLPPHARSVFTELAYLDRIMSQSTDHNHETNPVLQVRLHTLYKLLSLPRWEDIDGDTILPSDPAESHRSIYEICRLVCVIYSSTAILPIPPHNGWNARHTTRAIELLEIANFEMWTSNVEGLYLWALIICGMAAFDTPNREWFERTLGRYVHGKRITWEGLLEKVREFVWTDAVCKDGARELWDAAVGDPQQQHHHHHPLKKHLDLCEAEKANARIGVEDLRLSS